MHVYDEALCVQSCRLLSGTDTIFPSSSPDLAILDIRDVRAISPLLPPSLDCSSCVFSVDSVFLSDMLK